MFFRFATATAFLATFAAASPVSVAEAGTEVTAAAHDKRDYFSTFHLVNCHNKDTNLVSYSIGIYCPNDDNCNKNPEIVNLCTLPDGGVHQWESTWSQHCTTQSGAYTTWTIPLGSQTKADYTQVGEGAYVTTDGDLVPAFWYKDDKHTMYEDSHNNNCKTVYYALPKN